MRFASLVRKTTLETLRDWKVLSLTLTFAPFFTVLMHFYFDSASLSPYRMAVVNRDSGSTTEAGISVNRGDELIATLELAAQPDAGNALLVIRDSDSSAALARLETGSVDLVVIVPRDFSATLETYGSGGHMPASIVTTYGDPANPDYLMAAAWSDAVTYNFAADVAELVGPVAVNMRTVGTEDSLNEFDLYVPGMLALAVMMLMFTASATLIREKDKGTLVRLRMSKMTTTEWLLAVTIVQAVLGVLAVALTLGTATAFGYVPGGAVTALILVSALSSVAIAGISVLIAAWLRTVFDLMTIGCFPFFILMFFSGGMFPLPDVRLFEFAGRPVNANDILPTTHSISAFDEILNHAGGLGAVTFECALIILLSVVFFGLGTVAFARRHMSARAH